MNTSKKNGKNYYLNKYFVKYKYSFFTGIVFTIIAQIFMLFTPNWSVNLSSLSNHFLKIKHRHLSDFVKSWLTIFYWSLLPQLSGFSLFDETDSNRNVSTYWIWFKKRYSDIKKTYPMNFYKNRWRSNESHKRRCFKGENVCWVGVWSRLLIRFTIVIAYMYNVSPRLTLYTILPYLICLTYAITNCFPAIPYQLYTRNIFWNAR
jgi:ATP-binding cassette subfamily B protein